jgi:ankyrin repeat protein
MCKNESKRVYYSTSFDVNLTPILPAVSRYSTDHTPLTVDLKVHHITSAEDYQIFSALKEHNISLAFDLLEQHIGVNAVDEYGQTPLMIALTNNHVHIIGELMNTRKPTVDINFAKHSGFTALFYAVQHSQPAIIQGLLRRGADPTMVTVEHGNTPLHMACLLEKRKAAELLLEFGANPIALNAYGQTPVQMVPASAVPSNKLYFRKLFQVRVSETIVCVIDV